MNITDLKAGDLIGERYRLEGQIGEGGMASVWRALDQTLDRPVAVKFLYIRDVRQQTTMIRAFLREARIAAAVRHRNVVDILDFGTHQEDLPFMVMELLEGETVEDRLYRQEPFELEEILNIGARVLQGLVAVHEAGIVHRDLKPANIFLIKDRTGFYPKLLDFGISRSLEPQTGRESALTTQDGRIVGTLEYMSCEQARGQTDIDKRTDIYSLGVVLYELITGKLPFESEHQGDLIVQIMTSDPKPVHELNPEAGEALSSLIDKAMQRNRDHRFEDAEEMHAALISIAEEHIGQHFAQAMSIPPPGPFQRIPAKTQKLVFSKTPQDYVSTDPAPKREGSPQVDALSATELSKPADKPKTWIYWALASAIVVLITSAAIGYGILQSNSKPANDATRYIVVKGASESDDQKQIAMVTPEATSSPAPKTEEQPEPLVEKQTEDKPPSTINLSNKKDKPRKAEKPKPAKTQAERLAQRFSAQKAPVTKCFQTHRNEVDQASSLSVRLKLGTSGKVLNAQVLPNTLANTQIGKCIAQATKKMRFGPRSEPISFRVPLTARIGR